LSLLSKPKLKSTIFALLVLLIVLATFKETILSLFITFSKNITFSTGKYASQLEELKRRNLELSLKIERLKDIEEENRRLRKALDIKENSKIDLIPAAILGFCPSTWRRRAFINLGKNKGIKEGNLVINEDGFLVGKVSGVREDYSEIILLNDPEFSCSVFIEDKGMGFLEGTLGGRLKILYVEDNQGIRLNDKVWVGSGNLAFPIQIGRVSKAKKDKDQFFLDVEITPFANLYSIRQVFIIR
jgi:rod shape-determining protein MreC